MNSEEWRRVYELFELGLDLSPQAKRDLVKQLPEGESRIALTQLFEKDALEQPDTVPLVNRLMESATPETPRRLGSYRVIRPLEEGGMSLLYLGERDDQTYKTLVVIKILKFFEPRSMRQFHQERQILAELSHPNICQILDGGTTDDGRPYLVMEYIEGSPIHRYCRRNNATLNQRIGLFLNLCSSVACAHRNLVVHRDIKPNNILVTDDGRLKLLDFGIAKALQNDGVSKTDLERQPYTLNYASPEQLLNQPITTQTDIYGLGILLRELISGQNPNSEFESLEARLQSLRAGSTEAGDREINWPRLFSNPQSTSKGARRKWARALRSDLDFVIAKATAAKPDERYASVQEFILDLTRYQNSEPLTVREKHVVYGAVKWVKRHRLAVVFSAVLMMMGVMGAFVFYKQYHRIILEKDRRQLALVEAQKQRDQAQEATRFLTDLFKKSNPKENKGDIPTAVDLLELGRVRVEKLEDPSLRRAMFSTLGEAYHDLGRYEDAEILLHQALDLKMGRMKEEPEDFFLGLMALSVLLRDWGKWSEATPVTDSTLDFALTQFGESSPEFARALRLRAVELVHFGEFAAAEQNLVQALEIFRRQPQDPYDQVLSTLIDLSSMFHKQRDFEKAVVYQQKLVESRKCKSGEDSLTYAKSLRRMGNFLKKVGRLNEAGLRYKQAFQISEKILGAQHPNSVYALNNLAGLRYRQGRFQEAEVLSLRVIGLAEANFPKTHRVWSTVFNNLGAIYQALDRHDRALLFYQRSYDSDRANFGEEHYDLALGLNNMGTLLMNMGRYDEARDKLQRSLKMVQKLHGPSHTSIGIAYQNLGQLFVTIGAYDQAETHLFKALEHELTPFGHADALQELGGLYLSLERWELAGQLLKQSLAEKESIYGAPHPKTALSLRDLGRFYLSQDREELGFHYLLRAVDMGKGNANETAVSLAEHLLHLVRAAVFLGKTKDARTWLCEVDQVLPLNGVERFTPPMKLHLAEIYFSLVDMAQARHWLRILKNSEEPIAEPLQADGEMLWARLLWREGDLDAKTHLLKARVLAVKHFPKDHSLLGRIDALSNEINMAQNTQKARPRMQ